MKLLKNIFFLLFSVPIILIGAGSYRDDGSLSPQSWPTNKPPVAVKYYTNVTLPLPSSDWWTSLLTEKFGNSTIVVLPEEYRCEKLDDKRFGLSVFWNGNWGKHDYSWVGYDHNTDLYIRATNITTNNLTSKVCGWGDWNVDVLISDNAEWKLKVTLTKGSPFLYAYYQDSNSPYIYFNSTTYIFFDDNYNEILSMPGSSVMTDHIGVRLKNGKIYGIFAPQGSIFSNVNGKELQIKLGSGQHYLSTAVLSHVQDLSFYYEHAYAFVTNTKVIWNYNSAEQKVKTTFQAEVDLKRAGFSSSPIMTLLPHQWKYSTAPVSDITYVSPRGILKVLDSDNFTVQYDYRGIIGSWNIPTGSPTYSVITQKRYLEEYTNIITTWGAYNDGTYWQGKRLINMAQGIVIADELGETNIKNYFIAHLREVLTNWYTYTPGEDRHYFAYWNHASGATNNWGTLVGYKSEYGSSETLNDHHFHWGYFIYASALLARYETNFKNNYGNMVEQLIRDSHSWLRNDSMYPFLRNFDPYEGHCWAGGTGTGWAGNNQESTSESMNAWAAIYLWGVETDNNTIRDLGIYGYTTERHAIEQYWFNKDKDNWNPEWERKTVGILYGSEQIYGTFFGWVPEYIFGIHWLPVTPSLMYLGYDQELAQRLYNGMVLENNGPEDAWYNIIWSFEALFEPSTVLSKWDYDKVGGDEGHYIYNQIHNLDYLGNPITDVWAYNWSSYQVFRKNGTNAYVGYNHTSSPIQIVFVSGSDGCLGSLTVQPFSTRTSKTLGIVSDTLDHFVVEHSGKGYVNNYASVRIKAIDNYQVPMVNYTGSIILYASSASGIVSWTTNTNGNNGSLIDLGFGYYQYTFSLLDKGQVVLRVTDDTVESLDIEVTNISSITDNDANPQYLSFTNQPLMDHFEWISDGLAEINRPEIIGLQSVDNNGDVFKTMTTVTLGVATSSNAYLSWKSSITNYGNFSNIGGGKAIYTFSLEDSGIAHFSLNSTVTQTVDLEVHSVSGYTDNDTIPQYLTFKEQGWKIYVDWRNSGQSDGKTWSSAYPTITDALSDWGDGAENSIIIASGTYFEHINIDNKSGSLNYTNRIIGYTNGVILNATGRKYGIYISGVSSYNSIENLTITGASNSGIYVYVSSKNTFRRINAFKNLGNGIACQGSDDNRFYNCDFVSNSNDGIFFSGDSDRNTVFNCIIIGNQAGGINQASAVAYLDYNNVWGNSVGDYMGGAVISGTHHISTDASFVSLNLSDNTFAHIVSNSACVDAGDPKWNSDPNIYGEHIDIGSYEYVPSGKIIVLFPNGNEFWSAYSNYTVHWTSSNASSQIKLALLHDTDIIYWITSSTTNNGSFSFNIPGYIPYDTGYKIFISDVSNNHIADYSDNYFTITNDIYVRIISPNSNNKWIAGESYTNYWTSNRVSSLVQISLYSNNVFCANIAKSTTNDGVFVWTIPDGIVAATNYKIKITDYSNNLVYDFSDYFFSITNQKSFSNVVYVDRKQTRGPWTGLTWDCAYSNINDALHNFVNRSNMKMVIASGIYRGNILIENKHSGKFGYTNIITAYTNNVIIDDQHQSQQAITLTGAKYIRLQKMTILRSANLGLYSFVSYSNVFLRIIFSLNMGNGVSVQGGAGNKFINCTFYSNGGAGIFLANSSSETNIVWNSIFQDNGGAGIYGTTWLKHDYNNVFGNSAGTNGGYIGTAVGIHDISTGSNFEITYPYDKYFLNLRNTSLCIDAGDPAYPNYRGSAIDIGAKEYTNIICPIVSISSFSPVARSITNNNLIIQGTGFRNTQGYGFVSVGNYKLSEYTKWLDTEIQVKIPYGLSGTVFVSNSCGSFDSSSNLLILKPNITGFTPAEACPNALLAISGTNFGAVQDLGFVMVGNKKATINTWNDTSITVWVPDNGFGTITVQNQYGYDAVSSTNSLIKLTPVYAQASSTNSGSAFNTIDNNLGTRWESPASDPQWIYVDFSSSQLLNMMVIEWETAYTKTYKIEISTNAIDWIKIYSNQNITGLPNHWRQTNRFPGVNTRYVRFYGLDRATTWGHSMWEWEFYHTATPSIESNFTLTEIKNVAGFNPSHGCAGDGVTIYGDGFGNVQGNGKVYFGTYLATVQSWSNTVIHTLVPNGGEGEITVYNDCGITKSTITNHSIEVIPISAVSSTTSSSPLNVIDNNTGTRWESAWADNQWIYLDFGEKQWVDCVIVEWETAYSAKYALQISDDTIIWKTISSNSNVSGKQNHWIQTNCFEPAYGRYLRMYGYNRATIYGHSIWEMKAFLYRTNIFSMPDMGILSVLPTSGNIGDRVEITGYGFGSTQGTVHFANADVVVYSNWSDTNIIVSIPTNAVTGIVSITNNCGVVRNMISNFIVSNNSVLNAIPHFVVAKSISNIQLHNVISKAVPGAMIVYKIVCSNAGIGNGSDVVVYDKLSDFVKYYSGSAQFDSLWTNEFSTNTSPDQTYNSPDYIPLEPSNMKWIRWRKKTMAFGAKFVFTYKVTVK